MTAHNDIELGRGGTVGLFVLIGLLVMLLLDSCAHARPVLLWGMCRDECGKTGGSVAAVIGSTNPMPGEKPACLCHQQPAPEIT